MADKVNVQIEEPVAKTAESVARGIWFASGNSEPNLENAEQFLDLVACCAYALSGKRVGTKPNDR